MVFNTCILLEDVITYYRYGTQYSHIFSHRIIFEVSQIFMSFALQAGRPGARTAKIDANSTAFNTRNATEIKPKRYGRRGCHLRSSMSYKIGCVLSTVLSNISYGWFILIRITIENCICQLIIMSDNSSPINGISRILPYQK